MVRSSVGGLLGGYHVLVSSSSRISPTAHYVGYLKFRSGLSEPGFTTTTGRVIHHALWPLTTCARVLGGIDAQRVIAGRHMLLDELLVRLIEDGSVRQVVELAAGLSPRGYHISRRYRDRELLYVEGDLAGIVAHKRALLATMAPPPRGHHVVELDALVDTAPSSIFGVGERLLDPGVGTAVICEGLFPYLDRTTTLGLWRRVAQFLSGYAAGYYFSDVYFASSIEGLPMVDTLRGAFSVLTRGRLHFPFDDVHDVEAELGNVGFRSRVLGHADLTNAMALPTAPARSPLYVIDAQVHGRPANPREPDA